MEPDSSFRHEKRVIETNSVSTTRATSRERQTSICHSNDYSSSKNLVLQNHFNKVGVQGFGLDFGISTKDDFGDGFPIEVIKSLAGN